MTGGFDKVGATGGKEFNGTRIVVEGGRRRSKSLGGEDTLHKPDQYSHYQDRDIRTSIIIVLEHVVMMFQTHDQVKSGRATWRSRIHSSGFGASRSGQGLPRIGAALSGDDGELPIQYVIIASTR